MFLIKKSCPLRRNPVLYTSKPEKLFTMCTNTLANKSKHFNYHITRLNPRQKQLVFLKRLWKGSFEKFETVLSPGFLQGHRFKIRNLFFFRLAECQEKYYFYNIQNPAGKPDGFKINAIRANFA